MAKKGRIEPDSAHFYTKSTEKRKKIAKNC